MPTRRGRLAATLTVLVLLALTVLLATERASAPGPVATEEVVTVGVGETLSDVAAKRLPHLPVTEGIAAIRLVNELNSGEVRPGQILRIPRL